MSASYNAIFALHHSTPLHKTSILLLKAFISPLAVTFPVALFVLDMQFLWVYADDFIGKGIEPWVIAKLMFFASARIVNLALPLAILVASIMALGNLSERNRAYCLEISGIVSFKNNETSYRFHADCFCRISLVFQQCMAKCECEFFVLYCILLLANAQL